MVKGKTLFLSAVFGVGLWTINSGSAQAQTADEDVLFLPVSADACDDRQADDDKKTAENRAIDMASLNAIKTEGFLQKRYPKLSLEALDLVSYRIIDEYLIDVEHQVTHDDDQRVCIKLNATVEITTEELDLLAKEYKGINAFAESEMAEVAEQAQNSIQIEPQNINQQKLVYIAPMNFFDGTDTDHYTPYLTDLFSHSKYFFVTDDLKIADYVITPNLSSAEVSAIDAKNNRMQMVVELDTAAPTIQDFMPLSEQQNHFILFAADKDEQEVADKLIQKLLQRAAAATCSKLEKHLQKQIEDKVLNH